MQGRIAILGGTFDPVHIGHLALAADVRHTLAADMVLFVPTAQQPLKAQAHAASALDRLAMARLATSDNEHFAVSDVEIRRGGLSYTVDTLAQLREEHPDAELWFIVGADAAVDLPRWHDVRRLLRLCRLAIVARPGYTLDHAALFAALPEAEDRIEFVAGPALDISASELRARLRSGAPVRYHLPPAVRAYIAQHGLYRNDHAT